MRASLAWHARHDGQPTELSVLQASCDRHADQ